MQFDSITAFLEMGGYGFFVWLSFGFGFIALLILVLQSKSALKRAKSSIANRIVTEQKQKLAAQQQNSHR